MTLLCICIRPVDWIPSGYGLRYSRHTDSQCFAGLSVLGHGKAVKAGGDCGRRPWNTNEHSGNECAGHTANPDGKQQHKGCLSGKAKGNRQQKGNAQGCGMAPNTIPRETIATISSRLAGCRQTINALTYSDIYPTARSRRVLEKEIRPVYGLLRQLTTPPWVVPLSP